MNLMGKIVIVSEHLPAFSLFELAALRAKVANVDGTTVEDRI
jgi:hypothetical protein